jgi:hypothetical protein
MFQFKIQKKKMIYLMTDYNSNLPQNGIKVQNLEVNNNYGFELAELRSIYALVPAAFELANSSFNDNTYRSQQVILLENTTLAIMNCTFMNNEYIDQSNLVKAESNANIFLTNSRFLSENVSSANIVSTTYIPGVLTYDIQYFTLFIDSSIFDNVTSPFYLFELGSLFIIITNNIFQNLLLESTSLLSSSGAVIGSFANERNRSLEQAFYLIDCRHKKR